jgi:hypothetical protein
MEAPLLFERNTANAEVLQGICKSDLKEFQESAGVKDLFSSLPVDIKCEILCNMSPAILLRSRSVCKEWSQLLTHDTIWKVMVEQVYGVTKRESLEQSWFSLYKSLAESWNAWDPESHHPGITVAPAMVATCDPNCKNDTHLPIRGKQSVKAGRHYFEVSFSTRSDARPSFSSLLCAVGVADKTFPTDRKMGAGYTRENNGIGYYSSGFQFVCGKEVDYGSRVTFKVGNTIGFMLDMDNGTMQFYKDRKPIGQLHAVNKGAELYPLVLAERGLIISINKKLSAPELDAADMDVTQA